MNNSGKEFLNNFRNARLNPFSSSSSPSLITRGDMQKERQKQSTVSPDSFYTFLRGLFGVATKGKDQLNIKDVPAGNMDRMSPNEARAFMEQKRQNEQAAQNGSLRVENDLDKYNAAVNSDLYHEERSTFDNAFGVLQNYDALNKVLDEYDTINTWSGKRKFLKDAYKRFDDKNGDIGRWFSRLYDFTIEAQDFGEWDTRNVTDTMRRLNEHVKNRWLKKIQVLFCRYQKTTRHKVVF